MAKRLTDSSKWKKGFLKSLEAPYKLLWLYILDDCDHAGIWHVDFQIAQIQIGITVDKDKAIEVFGDHVEVIDDEKWFVSDFIEFQYGELCEKNRVHQSVMQILLKYKVGPFKALASPHTQRLGEGLRESQRIRPNQETIANEVFSDPFFTEQLDRNHKGKDFKKAFGECFTHWINSPRPPTEIGEWKQKLNSWLINKPIAKGKKVLTYDDVK